MASGIIRFGTVLCSGTASGIKVRSTTATILTAANIGSVAVGIAMSGADIVRAGGTQAITMRAPR